MYRPRLLLADDHAEAACLLRSLLQSEFDVIADVRDGNELVEAVERLSPDLIVSDISMPGLDGLAAASAILRRNPAARIIFVTVYDHVGLMERGMAAGAMGYVLKQSAGDELVTALCAALRGERFVSPSLGCPERRWMRANQ